MEFLEKHMKFILLGFAFISTVGGGLMAIDGRYAKADEHIALEKRVSLSELKTQLRAALDEYYFLKKQLRAHPEDEDLKEKVAEAKEHVDDLKDAIKAKS
jgi:hypothetical protein